jgi:hypothetical protein
MGTLGVLETWRLPNIDLLLYDTIQESTFHIHLIEFESLGCGKGSENPNDLKTSNRSKILSKV